MDNGERYYYLKRIMACLKSITFKHVRLRNNGGFYIDVGLTCHSCGLIEKWLRSSTEGLLKVTHKQ